MIPKHRFYFLLWKIWLFLRGIREGRLVKTKSFDSNKDVTGVIMSISGQSVNQQIWGLDINIHWLKPLNGHDSRYYTTGAYGIEDFDTKKVWLK